MFILGLFVQMGWSSGRDGRPRHIDVIVEIRELRDGPENDGVSRGVCSHRLGLVLAEGEDTARNGNLGPFV